MDIKAYRKNKLGRKARFKLSMPRLSDFCCLNFIYTVYNWYKTEFRIDTGLWCAKKLLFEVFEIFIQTTALLYYNGYILFSSSEYRTALAYKPRYIKLFAIFLSINCLFVCIVWLCYAIKPFICHGFIFALVLYSMDVIFDIFYTLFPLIVVTQHTPSIGVGLGYLQTDAPLSQNNICTCKLFCIYGFHTCTQNNILCHIHSNGIFEYWFIHILIASQTSNETMLFAIIAQYQFESTNGT